MSKNILSSRLPDRPAELMLVSGEYPELRASLSKLGIKTVATTADNRLPRPVQWHPDMQACIIGGKAIVLRDGSLHNMLSRYDIPVLQTLGLPKPVYPGDVLCNVLAWNGYVLGNFKTADVTIRQAAEKMKAAWLDVKQGYVACATVLVDEKSAITADEGIARCLKKNGMNVLRIHSGDILLPGYPYGFIGGCCGKLAPDVMAFAGKLDSHRDSEHIRTFLKIRGIKAIELMDGELLDVGGLVALC